MKIRESLFVVLWAAVSQPALAADGDEQCRNFSEQARLACTTTDRNAGSNGEMNQIFDISEGLNRGVNESGKCIAELYNNRALNSAAMARMSQLKANACANSLSLCHLHCGFSERLHRLRSQFAEAINDDEYSTNHGNMADERKSADDQCVGYINNVKLARQQAEQYLQAVEVNNSGRENSSVNQAESGKENSRTCLDVVLKSMKLNREDLKSKQKSSQGQAQSPQLEMPQELSSVNPASKAQDSSSTNAGETGAGGGPKRGKIMMSSVSGEPGGPGRAPANVTASAYLATTKADRLNGNKGMSIRKIDGITGPFGPSLFQKITRQYHLQEATLVQPDP